MGKRTGKHHYLIGQDNRSASEHDLDARLEQLLEEKMHGISFSAYTKGQKPGDELTREQIEHRMTLLAPRFNWIRSFFYHAGQRIHPTSCQGYGLKHLGRCLAWRKP